MAQEKPNYYTILGVTTSATKPEVDRAYLALKASGKLSPEAIWNLERAYVSLSDPNLKRKYDAELKASAETGESRQSERAAGGSRARIGLEPEDLIKRAKQMRLVAASLGALLLIVLWTQVWPHFAWHFQTFSPSTVLVELGTGQPFGVVLAYESDHHFRTNRRAAAYQIRRPDGTDVWLPKLEVTQLAKASP